MLTQQFGETGLKITEIEKIADSGATPGFSLSIITPDYSQAASFGFFSNELKAVREDTMYDIASITKLYTTGIVLRLHEQGKLSIFDNCSEYLNNFSDSKIRLIDLLTHKVDFGIMLSEFRSRYKTTFVEELLKIQPPKEPSHDIHYANLGFIYLGKIIEAVKDNNLNSVTNSFVESLGLQNTATGVEIEAKQILTPPTEVADGFCIQGKTHDESARLLGGVAGNAGLFASAQDLAMFGKAWIEGRVVAKDMLKDLVFQEYDPTRKHPQGLGWWRRLPTPHGEARLDNIFCHPGFTGSLLLVNPYAQKVCAFTCNRTYFGRDNLKHRGIWEIMAKWITTS